MADIASNDAARARAGRIEDEAVALAHLLEEHKGRDAMALDLRGLNSWTDFFVIATATSSTHLKGLMRHVKERVRELGIEVLHGHSSVEDDEWSFMDLGDVVVHVMSESARSFYELERLWHQAKIPYRGGSSPV